MRCHLEDGGLDVPGARRRGDGRRGNVLPDGAAGPAHHQQDLPVAEQHDAAGRRVAQHKQRQCVRARPGLPPCPLPVDAAGRAVGFGAVRPPVEQRGTGEEQRVRPAAANQETAVVWAQALACWDINVINIDIYIYQKLLSKAIYKDLLKETAIYHCGTER